MIPDTEAPARVRYSAPRVSGDDPGEFHGFDTEAECSPRERGGSRLHNKCLVVNEVLPA